MLSVCHQRRSQWLSFRRKFFTDIFVRVCFSNFLISGLRFFEEYNACYHFIHQQCFLLVTKDGHNLYVGVGSFVEINFAVCSGHFHHFWFAKLWSVWCFFHFFSSSVLSVGHQRWSQWLSFSRKFFTDIFVRVCFSNFLISGLRIFEEYSACYHFIHHQCCLLVNKNRHNLCLGVGRFVDFVLSVCF